MNYLLYYLPVKQKATTVYKNKTTIFSQKWFPEKQILQLNFTTCIAYVFPVQIELHTQLFENTKIKKNVRFGFFVLWHINLCRLFNANAILLEEQ